MAFIEKRNITLIKAREVLGKKYENLSDESLEELLDFTYTLCTKVVKKFMEKEHGKEKMFDLL